MYRIRNPLFCAYAIVIQQIIQFFLVVQVVADDYCNENVVCRSPLRCCSDGSNSCCVQDDDDEDLQHYGYRISIWNMWYFWFVILFILMSCFGGCGYYKQRQRVLQARSLNRPSLFLGRSRQSGTSRQTDGIVLARDPQAYFAYSNPSAEVVPDASLYPPAYSEVVSHPGLYPYNKSNLPPNPPESALPERSSTETVGMMPLPPPYSEVASSPTNHNTEVSGTQTSSQVDATQNA